ncbi:MAG: hypothetical protein K5656_00880, partial [Lachnospiraceae bacterium]|nr:hypothetical protein [Lachnospiraceae bacterium]
MRSAKNEDLELNSVFHEEKGGSGKMLIHYTDDIKEQISIGKRVVSEKPLIYSDPTIEVIKKHIAKINGEGIISPIDPEVAFYRSIYDYWAYGSDIREEFYYDFFKKNHQEKNEYVTFRNRFWYVDHLNEKKDRVLLDDK